MNFNPTARLATRPALVFDETLPVNQRREEIAAAIRAHQVVVVCGETGSGKTTQLPKICLDLGRGLHGFIGHTQPRRIAARATAARIAEELKSELGQHVGFKIRFTDQVTPASFIKLMTDGILLAETQTDPLLTQYDTLILDEAHERSLNIDFLLGYLKSVLAERKNARRELKLIVTSATLDAERFSQHFGGAPVIEVSGRLYPIEIRYRPFGENDDRDLNQAIVDAVEEAHRSGPGDVLVFLPGEREIREAHEALRKHAFGRGGELEILPLFARQTVAEQGRVFTAHQGRRVVLATNVAETSLTVPGIRYVIDSGLARVKRYSPRNKVEQLQVEPISRAAANQRAGRCGRMAAGICFRLYAEEDYNRRASYTEPEILRSSLAGVILRMKSLRLGEVEDFPFLEAPAPRLIADGYQLLAELGALHAPSSAAGQEGMPPPNIPRPEAGVRKRIPSGQDVPPPPNPRPGAGKMTDLPADVGMARWQLTPLGVELARLPLDPKIGRMLLAARDFGCLEEILVIAAALSVNDPRERPQEQAGTADQAHAKWKDEKSEFLAYLKLWTAADEVWKHESSNKQRQWCRQNFLSWLRLREWRDVHGQLQRLCHEHGWRENQLAANYEAIHKALLSGLLGHVGVKSADEPHYLGARGIKFFIHPGSSLVKKTGRWIVCAELVETSRLFARCVAKIEPEWLEQVGAHLLRRHVFEPHWEKSSGRVNAWERVTLHGLVIHARRRVAFGGPESPVEDRRQARELFIRHALVQGEVGEEWLKRWRFLQHNLHLVKEIEKLEHKARRPDVLVDEALIAAFYDEAIAEGISTVVDFERWRRDAEKADPRRLFLDKAQLMRHEAAGITTETFPPHLEHLCQQWRLGYKHDPGATDDGVTLSLPLAALNQAPATRLEWLVPGLLKEKVIALLKTLPQKYRHRLQPLEAFAAEFCALDPAFDLPLAKALTHAVEDRLALKLPLDAFRPGELKPHLSMNIRLLDEHGGTLAMSRNLAELRARFRERVAALFAAAEVAREDATVAAEAIHTDWTFGPLPELLEVRTGGRTTIGFPALADAGAGVRLAVFDTEAEAQRVHRQGLARLFALQLAPQVKAIEKLPGLREAALQFIGLGTEKELVAQLVTATLERTCLMPPLPSEKSVFVTRCDEGRGRLLLVAQELLRLVTGILGEAALLQKKLTSVQKAFPEASADIAAQRDALLAKGFIADTPFERLRHFPRYLKAATLRLEKARNEPARDARLMAEWQSLARPWQREWRGRQGEQDAFLMEFRWLLEELRVALFAQELKTPSPVSLKRLQKMWENRTS